MGALAKHGKYHYPVRLLKKEAGSKGWRVRFWWGCKFKTGDPRPNPQALVPESDLVDALYGDTTARRNIRVSILPRLALMPHVLINTAGQVHTCSRGSGR